LSGNVFSHQLGVELRFADLNDVDEDVVVGQMLDVFFELLNPRATLPVSFSESV
jgi:hypothetical protein